jgi:hypothetical protein
LNKHLEPKDSLLPNSKLPIKWIQSLPISRANPADLGSEFGNATFYQMLGYMATARSLLDSFIPILQNRPSIVLPKAVQKERSFHKLNNSIQKCTMSDNLKAFFTRNQNWTSDLIDYRDCLLHYEILSGSYLPSVIIIHSENRIIAQFIWLPDNPKVYSIRKFSFDKHIDYLGYAHSTYLKLVDLCFYILKDTCSEVIGRK